ncbi:MAG: metallophosphoesterase [Actinobacteria bacterium]|nr:metallophosphoesterase [Actinomycetota bacterium]
MTMTTDGGPGSVLVRGLEPATRHTVVIRGRRAGVPPQGLRRTVTTLPRPAGPELFRFATVSDLHLGETTFGYFGTMEEAPRHPDPHPVRAVRSALHDLSEWGAQLVVVKGDCTNDSRLDEWDLFGKLLAESGLPWEALPGNHDNRPVNRDRTLRHELYWLLRGGLIIRLFAKNPPRTGRPVTSLDGFHRLGYEPPQPVSAVDVDGLRIVLADTSEGFHVGAVRHAASDIVDAAADASRDRTPVFIAAHHYPMPLSIPHFWPPGVPADEADPFFQRLAAAATRRGASGPSAFYTAGHTHRHRRYERSAVVCTEVGSPKDYPGTWAGYIVYETGITQVVRRVSAPDVLRWTDYSGNAALGLWKWWSPGLRSHRCFYHQW